MPIGLEELLRCGACKLQYDIVANRPKLLVCHHCFCMQCVKTFIKTKHNQTAVCPTCSKTTCIGRNGVIGLPDNEYLLPQLYNLIEQEKAKVVVAVPESEVFISDDSEEEEEEDYGNQDEFVSDEDGFDIAGELEGATFFNGAMEAQNEEALEDDVPIFCQTCLDLAAPSCLSAHQFCNYDHGVKDLQVRLEDAVEQAEQNLLLEVSLLEENSKHMNIVQTSWTALGQHLDQSVASQNLSLSCAKSLLEKLPDAKLGLQSAKLGDPATLARAVNDTETLVANSVARLRQTRIKSKMWKNISSCKISIASAQLDDNPLVLALEMNEQTKEEMVCLLYALSKLAEERGASAIPVNIPSATPSRSLTPPAIMDRQCNGHLSTSPPPVNEWVHHNRKANKPEKSSSAFVPVTSKKIAKPMTSGCAYCFFDLGQGSTELGRVVMEVNCKSAPKMARNFIDLCTGKHGFGYFNSKLWKISSGDHIDGGDISEGGQCSIYDKQPFLGDASTLQDSLGALRMRGRGTSDDGQPIVGAQFMIWVRERKFKNYTRTLVFGRVTEGLEILSNMSETRQRKGKPFVPPVVIVRCGVME